MEGALTSRVHRFERKASIVALTYRIGREAHRQNRFSEFFEDNVCLPNRLVDSVFSRH